MADAITVLGGDGFIGRHLVRRLAADGHHVTVMSRFPGYRIGTDHPFNDLPNVRITAGDFAIRDDVEKAVASADYVFHLVTGTTPAASANDPYVDLDNIRYSIELMEACTATQVKRVIFFSSGGAVYGEGGQVPIPETTVPRPRSPYGIGKLTIEHYLRYFKQRSGLDYLVYRIANPYGPGQNIHGAQGVIPIFLHAMSNNQALPIYGDGSMVRDYLYIDDLIEMISRSYGAPHAHTTYNLGSGSGATINQLIEQMTAVTGLPASRQENPVPASFVERIVLDTSRFTNEFGTVPSVDLRLGIERTWQYVKTLS